MLDRWTSAVYEHGVRLALLLLSTTLAGVAPLQCSREPDPALRREETPPEALYDLATRFKARGEQAPYEQTLRYLVERYPNSRFAERAKQELAVAPASSASPP